MPGTMVLGVVNNQAYGPDFVLTPGSEGMKRLRLLKLKKLLLDATVRYRLVAPTQQTSCSLRTTGQEFLRIWCRRGLDAFVAGIGSIGTISESKTLKAANPNIQGLWYRS